MTEIEKFISDVEKIKKFDRQDNNNQIDYNRASSKYAAQFERSAKVTKSLAGTIFDYWEKEYIWKSSNLGEEPTAENILKLSAFLAFLNNTDENADVVTQEDWENLGELVNYEAEDMDIEKLTELMSILVDHGAI